MATLPSFVLDPSGQNITLNGAAPRTAAGYYALEGVDFGTQAIQTIINTGQYRLEDMDGVLSANRVSRQIVIPLRVQGSSKDDLGSKLSALSYAIAKANRYSTVDLQVTPGGSSVVTTFKIIGGQIGTGSPLGSSADGLYTVVTDQYNRWVGAVTLQALPFGYGAKQTYGSSGSPLVNAAGPASFTVSIPAGSEGDVLADVTVLWQATAAATGTLSVGSISGNTGWTIFQDVTSWSNGSGGGTRAAISNAKYKGGAAPGYTVSAVGTIEEAYKNTFSTTDFPTGVPIRVLLVADDQQVLAARRGLFQIRLAVTSGTVTQYGDWVSVPAAAGNGTTTHLSQGLDMGTFTFPPGPTALSVSYTGSTTIAIQVQDGNLNANKLAMAFDSIIFLPDASSLVAEWPVSQVASATTIRVENDMLFTDSDGSPQTPLMTGAHCRFRGSSRVGIWTSAVPLANSAGDATYNNTKAWVEYTPRYVGLAPV